MTSLTLAAILQLSLLASTPETYAEAHQQTTKTGQPMVVMVGAEWCPACKQMENNVLPKIRERGLLSRVAFALVNLDHDTDLGRKLTDGGPIPQLIVYRQGKDGWHRNRLIGGQSIQTVEEFINAEIAENEVNGIKVTPDKTEEKPVNSQAAEKNQKPTAEKVAIRPVSTN